MFAKTIMAGLLGTSMIAGAAFAQTATTPASPMNNSATTTTTTTAAAPNAYKGQWRTSKLIGLNVYNANNESLGEINEILVDQSGKVQAVVIGVGGFLGIGERNVAVPMDKVKFVNEPRASTTAANTTATRPVGAPAAGTATTTTTTGAATGTAATTTARTGNEWYPDHAVYNATKDELKALPEFKYS
jgi:sporulation protein YlmC with PRC-barrel domain